MTDSRLLAIDAIRHNEIVSIEFFRAMLGDLLGEGRDRYVFQSVFNKNEVIKFDMSLENSNVIEWTVWNDIKHDKATAKWFAPVIKMSPCGRVLVMRKADMYRDRSTYPKRLPSFFGDIKYTNFGFIGNQCVCVDYAINYLNTLGGKVKLIPAKY
jgi:hypothetical protein